jgi:FAD/FMN-containing dehydrogenase
MTSLTEFKAAFQGDLVFPEDSDYRAAIARWSITSERNAAIVAFVKTNEDVGLAIKYAKANSLAIAILGGGHSTAGTSSTEGGLVIDLSRYFAWARVDAEKKLIYVGGGALWKTVDEAAIKYGLATVGGTVNHVRFRFLSVEAKLC